jgi:hypothetical protein
VSAIRQTVLSASELDEKIAQVKDELAGAMQQQDFDKCQEFKATLLKLQERRSKIPTAAELDEQISDIKSRLATSMQEEDFDQCRELKCQLVSVQQKRSAMPIPAIPEQVATSQRTEAQPLPPVPAFESTAALERVAASPAPGSMSKRSHGQTGR